MKHLKGNELQITINKYKKHSETVEINKKNRNNLGYSRLYKINIH